MKTKLLLLGCGDIAIRLANILSNTEIQCFGVRRDISKLPGNIQGIQLDITSPQGFSNKLEKNFDIVVMTLVPSERSDEGYRKIYAESLNVIVKSLEATIKPPKLILFVSSTSVYAQDNGEWVSELSPTCPATYAGQYIKSAEDCVLNSVIPSTIVRFSGIYGPGRRHLIQQVIDGDRGENNKAYSNRIHADDCAGVLKHLIEKQLDHQVLEDIYLATDCEPVKTQDVKQWMANKMDLAAARVVQNQKKGETNKTSSGINKRCSNKRLLDSGFQFGYPTYRDGYASLLRDEGLAKNN